MCYKRAIAIILTAVMILPLFSCDVLYPPIPTTEPTQDSSTAAPTERPGEPSTAEPSTATPSTQPAVQTTAPYYAKYEELLPTNIRMSDSRRTALKLLEGLPQRDFGGAVFTIATTDSDALGVDQGGTLINQAKYFRNRAVEKKYNIKINVVEHNEATFFADAMAAYRSGDYFGDMLCSSMRMLSYFIGEDLLVNMRSLPFMNLRSEYYSPSAIQAASGGHKVYALYDGITASPDYEWAVFYNRDMLRTIGAEDPYNTVKAGRDWDFASFSQICELALRDMDGNKRMGEGDIFGHATPADWGKYLLALFASSGIHFFSYGKYERPAMDYYNDRTIGVIDTLKAFLKGNPTQYPAKQPQDAVDTFKAGRSAFLLYQLASLPEVAEASFDWGVLPMPKFDAEQSYACYVDDNLPGIAVLKGLYEAEVTGLITEAMSAASYKHISEEYVNGCMNYYMRSFEAVEMLNLIVANPYYDMAYVMGAGVPEVGQASYEVVRTVIDVNNDFTLAYNNNVKSFDSFAERFFK